jgi:hypothetical protein
MSLETHEDEKNEEGETYVDTVIKDITTSSPLCRFWKLVMHGSDPAYEVEPWKEDVLDDEQRSLVQELLAKHFNARVQGVELSDIHVDLFTSFAGLPVWADTGVSPEIITIHTRIKVELRTGDLVWCRPDTSFAWKALRQLQNGSWPRFSQTELDAALKSFQDGDEQSL